MGYIPPAFTEFQDPVQDHGSDPTQSHLPLPLTNRCYTGRTTCNRQSRNYTQTNESHPCLFRTWSLARGGWLVTYPKYGYGYLVDVVQQVHFSRIFDLPVSRQTRGNCGASTQLTQRPSGQSHTHWPGLQRVALMTTICLVLLYLDFPLPSLFSLTTDFPLSRLFFVRQRAFCSRPVLVHGH